MALSCALYSIKVSQDFEISWWFQERKKREEAGKGTEESKEEEAEASEERVITLRPLNMEDMRKAKTQV